MIDYLLMGSAFLLAVSQAVVIITLDRYHESLLLFQINDVLYPSFILMFLIHGARLRWDRTPQIIKLISSIWYSFLVLAVMFYEIIELPSEGQVLFFRLKNTSVREEGQMLVLNGYYIVGRGFEFYAHAFRLFSIIIILYSYGQAGDIAKEMNINRSRIIFLLSILSAAVFPIFMMGRMLYLWGELSFMFDFHIFDLFTFMGITFIAIKYPETLLISKTQILRVMRLHQEVISNNMIDQTMDEVFERTTDYISFLKELLPEMFSDSHIGD
jgi:hypothetical protein